MTNAVLVLNAGSSSMKFTLFAVADAPSDVAASDVRLCDGQITTTGNGIRMTAVDGNGTCLIDRELPNDLSQTHRLHFLLDWIDGAFAGVTLLVAAHRVVHGGMQFDGPVIIDDAVLAELRSLIPLAPLHQPQSIAAIDTLRRRHPGLTQISCFDTAFHRTMPLVERSFALPRALTKQGVQRYGFHGLSFEYIAGKLETYLGARLAAGRVVVAHLGAGASLCALRCGASIATTMSFTPLDGLLMGSRCGRLDPGVVLYLMQAKGMSAEAVANMLYQDSGLLGVSGLSSDMRVLLASPAPEAAEAVELFVYAVSRELGAMAAALGGIDALVFTGGIGERSAPVRERICKAATWLGIICDPKANASGAACISHATSRASAWVLSTDEDRMIYRHALALLSKANDLCI